MRSELTNRAGDEGRKRRRKPAANGFTLIELLVVIGVIAILAALSG
ncbi:MAG TPA: prepilin-type N-terminal cleavage/methylation domain-containing protein [Verrucomicrobiae bacterium]|nr:prepilin-type N-terminal cleavage/methylation domain-containing protein [Verrucomicrobiae bacterium]